MLLEECKQDEAPLLSVEDDVSNDESAQFTDLSFPWPLINAIKKFYVLFQSKSKLTKEFRLFLSSELIVIIICIVFIIYGSIGHQECSGYSMACKALIVQGACGLFVALSYACSLLFDWTPSRIVDLPPHQRLAIWYFIAFTHLVTFFCIIWFLISHIWFIQEFLIITGSNHFKCNLSIYLLNTIMFVLQYIMAIWLFYCFIWNNSQILSCLKKKIQHRLNQIPNNNEGSTIHQQSVDDLQSVTDV